MRLFSILVFSLILAAGWENDFEEAKKHAEKEHKLILLNFSGSDWCVPCIQFRKLVLDADPFTTYATENLVLVNADFPRLSKNQLSKEMQKKNDKLADKYNPEGIFPYTLLLDADGKVLKTWEGFPRMSAEEFSVEIKDIVNARH